MASLYKRPNSPFWWIKFRDPATGKIKQESTKYKIGVPKDKINAVNLKLEYTKKENDGNKVAYDHHFANWVESFLLARHANCKLTSDANIRIWKSIQAFFDEKGIYAPQQVERSHCFQYMDWRRKLRHLNGNKTISQNTLIRDVKVLNKVLQEAVDRRHISANPCARLGLKKERVREKGEMAEDQVEIIRADIKRRMENAKTTHKKEIADFYNVSFEIAYHQGIRFCETHLDLYRDVDFENNQLRIEAKGGQVYTAPLNPNLVPFLKNLKAEGRQLTYRMPKLPSLRWFKFFERLRKVYPAMGFNNISFHSTRVTLVSRLERAGAPESVVMKMVNHASTTVHRFYRRIKKSEMDAFWSAATNPVLPGSDAPPKTLDGPRATPEQE